MNDQQCSVYYKHVLQLSSAYAHTLQCEQKQTLYNLQNKKVGYSSCFCYCCCCVNFPILMELEWLLKWVSYSVCCEQALSSVYTESSHRNCTNR